MKAGWLFVFISAEVYGYVIREGSGSSSLELEDVEKSLDETRVELCMKHCGNVRNCYIQTSIINETESVQKPVCMKDSFKKDGTYYIEHVTPTPQFHPNLLIEEDFTHPPIICSIRCDEGKKCEIVDLPCFDGEPCPEIDVCVDDV